MLRKRTAAIAAVLTLGVAGASSIAGAATVAFDLVSSSSRNLISYSNAFTDAWSSAGDGFQIYQRGVSPTIPFTVLDDSLVTFPTDTIGIIDDNNTDAFFGVVDTVNNDSPGTVSATWAFDISGFEELSLSIDMGAMGDFESSDVFSWAYSIDGGALMTAFSNSVDEAGSHTYTLASGTMTTLSDPMYANGTLLTNQLQTLSESLLGTGSVLELTLTATFNGGSEGAAFQNIVISGIPEPGTLALVGLGLIGLVRLRRKT